MTGGEPPYKTGGFVVQRTKNSKFHRFINNENTVGYVFAAPFIIGFLGFAIIPILTSFYYSFTDYNLIEKANLVGVDNYLRLFQDDRFWKSVRVTLKYVFTSVPLKLAFALFVAMLLTKKTKAQSIYRSLYYVPSLIGGSIAVALVWKELFSQKGLINQVIMQVGLEKISWFGNQKAAMIPLILMSVWQFGSSMIIFAAGLKQIPITYYEAAKIDGANPLKSFLRITIPCLSPVILYNLVMQTIAAFMSFTQAFVITKGGPNDATNFYALYVYNHGFKYYDMGYASAMSWVMLVVMSIITFVIFKSSKYWVFSEAER
jgi:multiple sugar transport system permease protein